MRSTKPRNGAEQHRIQQPTPTCGWTTGRSDGQRVPSSDALDGHVAAPRFPAERRCEAPFRFLRPWWRRTDRTAFRSRHRGYPVHYRGYGHRPPYLGLPLMHDRPWHNLIAHRADALPATCRSSTGRPCAWRTSPVSGFRIRRPPARDRERAVLASLRPAFYARLQCRSLASAARRMPLPGDRCGASQASVCENVGALTPPSHR